MKQLTITAALFFYLFPSVAQLTVTASAVNSTICLGDSTAISASAFPVSYNITSIANNPVPSPGFQSIFLVDAGIIQTTLSSGTLDDGRWDNINLPFTFRYYGNDYNSINISTNGWIGLGSNNNTTTGMGVALPNAASPNNVIHAITADLDFRSPTSSSIEYFYEGSSPGTKFIIRYNDIKFFGKPGTANVEVILYETTNEIEIHTSDCTNTTLFKAQGIENNTGTVAVTVPGRNNIKVWNGMPDAYRFSPDQFTYTWTPVTGLTSNMGPKVSAHPTTTTTYTINAINNANAQSGSTTVTLNISNSSHILATASPGVEICQNKVVGSGLTYFRDGNCNLITTILPSGINPVANSINSCMTIYTAPGDLGTADFYLARKYDIQPIVNAANATATVTLYYLQSEFDAYNLAAVSNDVTMLPTGPSDASGINNLILRQFHGTGTTPDNYTGASVDFTTVNPGFNVSWNNSDNWWEVTVPVEGFSGFYVTSSPSNSLPISLLYFQGSPSGTDHLLNWKVNCLSTKVTFELENSSDGINFISIGKIEATQIRCSQPFDFINKNPLQGSNYYRIKIIDIDGRFAYSNIVMLFAKSKNFQFVSLFPNPVKDENTTLQINSGRSDNLQLVITDAIGRIISRQNFQLTQGNNQVTINTKKLVPGIYHINGSNIEGRLETIKFVKQ
ncbi:MAG: T9SS type A sorting domain-containing protein [Ginsengibacter sp.]